MKTPAVLWAILLGLAALSLPALGQPAAAETDAATPTAAALKLYAAASPGNSQLYNGPEYLDYSKRFRIRTGHQFFASPTPLPGSVYYNDHYFSGLQLAYDAVLDQVVLGVPSSPLTLRFINDNVRYFTLDGHRFVRIVADSTTADVLRTGFYEVLVDSTVQVLAKRAKRMQERAEQQYINAEFTVTDKLFIKKAGRYYPVSSKSSVTRLFADRSKEIQQYAQEHKLKFGKATREAAVVQLAAYYCSLPPR